jgi:hypothetical protein
MFLLLHLSVYTPWPCDVVSEPGRCEPPVIKMFPPKIGYILVGVNVIEMGGFEGFEREKEDSFYWTSD